MPNTVLADGPKNKVYINSLPWLFFQSRNYRPIMERLFGCAMLYYHVPILIHNIQGFPLFRPACSFDADILAKMPIMGLH